MGKIASTKTRYIRTRTIFHRNPSPSRALDPVTSQKACPAVNVFYHQHRTIRWRNQPSKAFNYCQFHVPRPPPPPPHIDRAFPSVQPANLSRPAFGSDRWNRRFHCARNTTYNTLTDRAAQLSRRFQSLIGTRRHGRKQRASLLLINAESRVGISSVRKNRARHRRLPQPFESTRCSHRNPSENGKLSENTNYRRTAFSGQLIAMNDSGSVPNYRLITANLSRIIYIPLACARVMLNINNLNIFKPVSLENNY